VSDLPNMYGDLYDMSKRKGYNVDDPFWKRENTKEVRTARDRGDSLDRSIWSHLSYGGFAKDVWGNMRGCHQPGYVTRISELLLGGDPVDLWIHTMQPGDQLYRGGIPMFYPY
jgi:hypothetical protein